MQGILQTMPRGGSWRELLLLLFFCLLAMNIAFAQSTITGKIVSSEDRSPIPGVNILIKGSTNGTISDADGMYSISAQSSADVLVFSFVGFSSQEVSIDGRTVIDITMLSDATQLSDVVVTALGIEKDVAKLGYSTQKVQGSDLVKAREPNPLNSLVGKVAGLTVGISSEMLGRPQLVLRGETNLLVVVDGVPVATDTWNLSPDDIESYQVLKGPNAAALYGSRGQNGAIVITTKRGSKNKPFSIEFNSSTMMDKGFLTIPKVQEEYGPGEYNTYKFGDDPFGQVNGFNQNDYDVWGPRFNGQLITQYDSPVDPATGIRQGTPWVARGKGNLKRYVQAGILSTNNIALATATEKYDIRLSYTQSYQRGIVPNTELNISNLNITTGYNLTNKLRVESNINYNKQYTPNYPDVNYGPNSMIYNIDIWAGADWDIDDLKNYWQPGKVGIQQRNFEYYRYNNPWFMAKEWLRGHYKTDVYGYMALKYEINDWLKASVRTQVTTWDLLRTEKFPYSADVYGREQKQGDYREDRRNLFENNTDALLTADKQLGFIHFSGLVGANLRTYKFNSSYATTDYLNVPGVYNFANSKNPVKVYNYSAPMQIASGYYSFDFGLGNYATISTTGRLDKFSTFYKGYNTGFYPSVAVSTVVNNYVPLPEVISFFKVRGSYANVKNAFTQSTIGPAWNAINAGNPLDYGSTYQSAYDGPVYFNNTYSISKPYNNIGAAYYTGVLSSQTLKPSATSSMEAGFDSKFLDNRVGLDFTIYKAIKGPGIVTQQYSEASGFQGGYINGVKTEKNGFEIALSGTPIQTSNGFSWHVATNWSHYVEKIKEFYDGVTTLNGGYLGLDNRIAYKAGDRVDNFYGYDFYRSPDGQIIHDASGLPLRDNRVAKLLGHYNPDYVWSFINTLTIKNFSFNFQFDGRIGGKGIDYVYRKLMQGGRAIETIQGAFGEARLAEFNANPNDDPTIYTATYTGEGVQIRSNAGDVAPTYSNGEITNLDQLSFVANTTKQYLQDYIGRYVGFDEPVTISKSFAKLRQVVITYNIPSSAIKKLGLNSATISLTGRNLLYFAERKDIDLDSFIGTTTSSQMLQSPTLRRYGFNLNLSF